MKPYHSGCSVFFFLFLLFYYLQFSHDDSTAMLVCRKKGTAAISLLAPEAGSHLKNSGNSSSWQVLETTGVFLT